MVVFFLFFYLVNISKSKEMYGSEFDSIDGIF